MTAETRVRKACGYESGPGEIMWPDESGEESLCQKCWEAECSKLWWERAAPFWPGPLPDQDEMDRVADFFDGLRR